MKSKTVIKVDLARSSYGPWVEAVQGDGGTRCVSVQLLDNGKPWFPPESAEIAIVYTQPGGTKGLYNKLPDGRTAISVSGNTVTAIMIPKMLAVPGEVRAAIIFNNSQLDQLTTFPFSIKVAKNQFAGAQEVEDYIRLQWLEDKLEERIAQLISTEQAVRAGVAAQEANTAAAAAQAQAAAAWNAASAANAAASRADAAAARANAAKENAETAVEAANSAAAAAQEQAAASGNAAGAANASASRADAAAAGVNAAKENADTAAEAANTAAEAAQAVVDGIVPEVEQLRSDLTGITPDDASIDGKPWTSRQTIDSICQPFSETGNPVQCYPVENYPLGVKVQIEPKQEGEGDPGPENVRPITGTVSVQIVHSNDAGVSRTYDIALPETVYGGVLDVQTGVLTVDRHIYTITGDEVWGLSSDGSIRCFIEAPKIPSGRYEEAIYTHYVTGTMYVGDGMLSAKYKGKLILSFNARLVSNTGYTVESLKEYLKTQYAGGTPVQACYSIDQPYTIQLTPQQITALSGVNTIFTDADGVIVAGREDLNHTITQLKNAVLSLGCNI